MAQSQGVLDGRKPLDAGNKARKAQQRAKPTHEIKREKATHLSDISRQVDWYGEKLSPEDWGNTFCRQASKAAYVPGLDGGFVKN